MGSDLHRSIPGHKLDFAAAESAVTLGWPAVEPIADELLEWVKDLNWPVASLLAPLLGSAGAALAPRVQRILRADDETRKYFLIQGVVALSIPMCRAVEADLRRIAERPTDAERHEEVDIVAREVLAQL